MSQDDLDLTPTEDLIDAIGRRCGRGGCVVLRAEDVPDGSQKMTLATRGGWALAYGLINWGLDYMGRHDNGPLTTDD